MSCIKINCHLVIKIYFFKKLFLKHSTGIIYKSCLFAYFLQFFPKVFFFVFWTVVTVDLVFSHHVLPKVDTQWSLDGLIRSASLYSFAYRILQWSYPKYDQEVRHFLESFDQFNMHIGSIILQRVCNSVVSLTDIRRVYSVVT